MKELTLGILAKCEDCGKEQRMYTPNHDRTAAEQLAGLMDGSSPLFKYPPPRPRPSDDPAQTFIGRCESCGGHFCCTLFGYDDDPAIP